MVDTYSLSLHAVQVSHNFRRHFLLFTQFSPCGRLINFVVTSYRILLVTKQLRQRKAAAGWNDSWAIFGLYLGGRSVLQLCGGNEVERYYIGRLAVAAVRTRAGELCR